MVGPLRVALVGPCPADLRHAFGGVDAVVALLARGLAESGVRVDLLTCDFDGGLGATIEEGGVRQHRLAARKGVGRVSFYARERAWIRRRLREIAPDVVHVHGTDFYAAAAVRHAGPRLLTVHGILARETNDYEGVSPLQRLPRALRAWANARFEDGCLRRAPEVVVLNGYVRAAVEPRTRARLHEIPNPIDRAYFEIPDRTVPDRLLFVGAIRPRKGLLDLARALPAVVAARPGVRLHVVGKTTDASYEAAVRGTIAREGIERHVVWRGPLDEASLRAEFGACALLVLPSVEESAPLVVAQAMAAGKPVVAHAVGGVPHLVAEGETGLLAPRGDAPAMAQAILALLAGEARRRAMGACAAAAARERFDPRVVVERTVSLYRQIATENGRNGTASP